MLDRFPFLCFNMIGNCLSSLVNAESDDSNLVFPCITLLLYHLLVVSHWCLAWWAPGSPEVDHPGLSIVLKRHFVVTVNCCHISNGLILLAGSKLSCDRNLNSLDSIDEWLNSCIEGCDAFLHAWWQLLLDNEGYIVLISFLFHIIDYFGDSLHLSCDAVLSQEISNLLGEGLLLLC